MRNDLSILLAVAVLSSSSCSSYVDSRVEADIRDALPRVIGPAYSYEVQVSGSTIGASRFDRVRVVGHRVARSNTPVIDRIELDLRGVTVDRKERRLTALDAADGQVRVRGSDLAAYLQQRGWVADPRVRFDPPDRVSVTGAPIIAGFPIAAAASEFEGRLVPQGAQLRLAVDRLRVGNAVASALVRALLESTINPIFDTSGYPVPAVIVGAASNGDDVVIHGSGSRLAPSSSATTEH